MDWTPQEDVMQKVLDVLEDSFIPDSTVQRNVQEDLRVLQQNPEFCSYLLLICECNQSFDDKKRALAGLILKNNIVYLYANIPQYVKHQMQNKCLAMLSDTSKEVRLSASVLINVMVQREGLTSMSNVVTVILNMLGAANDDVCEAAMKTLVLLTEDYLNGLGYGMSIDVTIKGLLGTFIELTGHRCVEVRKWAFRILNETLQKHFFLVSADFDRRTYLEKLVSHAIDEHPQIILAVVQGFVIFVNNQDDTILSAMSDVICYMITKSVDENVDIALQAGEFWLTLSKLQLCVGMLRGHLKTLIPILLKNMRKCPRSLLSPIIKIAIEEVRNNCKKDPIACGFNKSECAYEPLKFMQSVILQVNEICLRYRDNSVLCTLPSPGPPYNMVSHHAVRNTRRRMEDRHVIVHDLNTIFNKSEVSPSSYYAIFDGHGGQEAAAYSAAHLHQYLAESKFFAGQPDTALVEAFCRTDLLFIEKCKVENFFGGTTAVCALLRPKEKSLFVAWVGDSQAILARQGLVEQCVLPHKPDREDEKLRIEQKGGTVVYWGPARVNGHLAVSRAIGDSEYKPFITAEPDVQEYSLDGTEDFLVMACDGLWDVLQDGETAAIVYNAIYKDPDTVTDIIAQLLVQESKNKGSSDNITVIVVFLKEPAKIAAEPCREIRLVDERMEAGLDSTNASSNPFANTNGGDILGSHQKDAFLLDLDGFRSTANTLPTSGDPFFTGSNGKDDYHDEDLDDLGPETDVDAVDEVQSPVKLIDSMSEELEEKVAKEIDANLLKVGNCFSNMEQDDEDDPEEEMHGNVERKAEHRAPPAEEVHDAGLDTDSEDDEWNYIKPTKEDDNKENQDPCEESNDTPIEQSQEDNAQAVDGSEEIDTMSQLNPNAEEFVPVSPTRMEHNRTDWAALKDEPILAQSPRRPNPHCDFNVPEENDFAEDVKNRPSDVYSNGHENGHKQSSQEILENLLNGKNIDELEFQPAESPSKLTVGAATGQFIFGLNSGAFSTPTKFMDQSRSSTNANYGDESSIDESDLLERLNKERDPMSMSFYQDKDNDESPFDVAKEERDTDEKDQEEPISKEFDDSMSELPEHDLLVNAVTTDLDHHDDCGIKELPKSPLLEDSVIVLSDISSNELADTSSCLVQDSQDRIIYLENVSQPSVVDDVKMFDTDEEIIEHAQEPLAEVGAKSPLPGVILEEHVVDDFAPNDVHISEDEPVLHPEAIICYANKEAEVYHQEATSEEITESPEVERQEFIPETSLEVAQSPEPVVLENTPEQELLPIMSEGVHKFNDGLAEPEVCLISAPEPVIPEVASMSEILELAPPAEAVYVTEPSPAVEQLVENPIVEQIPLIESPVLEHSAPIESPVVEQCSPTESPIIEDKLVAEADFSAESPIVEQMPIERSVGKQMPIEHSVAKQMPIEHSVGKQMPIEHSVGKQMPIEHPVDVQSLPVESPTVEHFSPVESPLIEKHVEDLIEPETSKIVEPLMTAESCPIEDITISHEVAEITTPVDEITSSVKDDSPIEEIKEIKDNELLLESPIEVAPPSPCLYQPVEHQQELQPVETVLEEVSPVEPIKQIAEICEPTTAISETELSKVEEVPVADITAAAAAVAAAVTTVAVGAGVVAEAETKKAAAKPKTSTIPPVKKTSATTKTTTKPLASKTAAAAKPASAIRATVSKTNSAKLASTTTAAKVPAKPRVPLSATSKLSVEKKPLTNGDAKAAAPVAKVPPIRRPQMPSTTKTTVPKTTATPAKLPATTAPKPIAAKPASTLKPATKPTTVTPKLKATPLSSKTTITTTARTTTSRPLSSSTTTTKTTTVKTTTSTASVAAKPKPISATLSKPRVALSARTTTRAPDAEKQNKENVNKLTASRTSASKTTTARKVDATKTTSASKTSTMNKPTSVKKPLAKTTNSALNKSKQEKETIVPNGVPAEKAKESSINEADQLMKDLSPVELILDNSQLADATAD